MRGSRKSLEDAAQTLLSSTLPAVRSFGRIRKNKDFLAAVFGGLDAHEIQKGAEKIKDLIP
jgi:hypothetical protein